ncbi:hypothetical protein AAVH_19319 [Aphelenchoides avenae]|nr:hypothetical protein AAVH_19319 [Aphelenchus avenae]
MKVYRDKTIPQLNLNFNTQLGSKTQEAHNAKEKLRETEEKLRETEEKLRVTEEKLRETEAKLFSEQAKRLKHYRNETHKAANEAANATMRPVKHEIVHHRSPEAPVVLHQEDTAMYSDDNDNVHSTTPADAEDSNGDRPGSTQSIADIKVNLTEVAALAEQYDDEPVDGWLEEEMIADDSFPEMTHPSLRQETEVDREESQDVKRSAVHEEEELPITQEPAISSTTSAQCPSTSGIVPSRGRGRPRKDGQPNKSTKKIQAARNVALNPRKRKYLADGCDATHQASSRGASRYLPRRIPGAPPTKLHVFTNAASHPSGLVSRITDMTRDEIFRHFAKALPRDFELPRTLPLLPAHIFPSFSGAH